MHRIACIFLVMPYADVIEWIVTHMDEYHLVLRSESGGHLTTYFGEDMKTYHNMLRPIEYENDNFNMRWDNLDTSDII